tara:strand:+ start:397 stop:789 length:393 start_codon:yes stop_codon:yes gene_type:complete
MTRILSAGLLTALCSLPALAENCPDLKGCERKFCEIQSELTQAQAAGNDSKVAGLTRSLQQAQANCSTENLQAELQDDLKDAHEDLAEYQADLEEAQGDADAEKVAKYQQKMAEERSEIEQLESELKALE